MHILSLLAIIVFGLSTMRNYNSEYDLKEMRYKIAVTFIGGSMTWCALTSSQFYIAATKETAWFWHRLSTIGWIAIVPSTAIYMLYMAGKGAFFSKIKNRVIFYLLPFILMMYSLFGSGTIVATDVVQSRIGWGWTYVNKITSVWLWLYILMHAVYMGGAIYFLNKDAKKEEYKPKAKLTAFFTVFDSLIITISMITDVILPLFTDYFVPLGSILNIVAIIIYAYLSKFYDTLHIERFISSEVIFKTSTAAFMVIDERGYVFFNNDKAIDIFSKNNEDIKNLYYDSIFVKDENYYEAVKEFREKKCFYEKILHIYNNDIKRSIMVSASECFDSKKNLLGYVVSGQDVTKIVNVNELLEKQNNTDELTGLLNRKCFFKTSKKYIKDYNEKNINFAAISIDVDNFKGINDTHGNGIGDLVLIEVSNLLKDILREDELLFRVNGDEFIILVNEIYLIERINELEEKIDNLMNTVLNIEGTIINLSLSYGSELYSEGRNFDDFIKNADNRMYKNKINKKN